MQQVIFEQEAKTREEIAACNNTSNSYTYITDDDGQLCAIVYSTPTEAEAVEMMQMLNMATHKSIQIHEFIVVSDHAPYPDVLEPGFIGNTMVERYQKRYHLIRPKALAFICIMARMGFDPSEPSEMTALAEAKVMDVMDKFNTHNIF